MCIKHYYLISLMLTLLFTECKKSTGSGTNQSSKFHTIDFEQSFDMEQKMLISEIADLVEYLELKTPKNIIIAKIHDVKQIDDYLIVRSRLDAYLFHKNGQFIRQIGSRGQGPGEYSFASNVEIDRIKKEIVIVDYQQLLFYDLDGNFLRSKKEIDDVPYIGISNSILWMGDIIESANTKYKAIALSLQGDRDTLAYIPNSLYGIIKSDKTDAAYTPYTTLFYHKNDSLYFKGDESNDTIWKISGVHAAPHAFIDLGKYKMPVEFEPWYSSYETYQQHRDKYWSVSSLVEDNRYFYLLSHWKRPDQEGRGYAAFKYIVYDKKKRTGFSAKDHNGMGITDDIQGGPPIWPRWTSDEFYINTIEAYKLLEKVETGKYNPSPQLEELLARINEDSNDLIILCRRKKIEE